MQASLDHNRLQGSFKRNICEDPGFRSRQLQHHLIIRADADDSVRDVTCDDVFCFLLRTLI